MHHEPSLRSDIRGSSPRIDEFIYLTDIHTVTVSKALTPNGNTQKNIPNPSSLKDPWDMPVPQTDIMIEWYGYRRAIPSAAFRHCVDEAVQDVREHLRRGEAAMALSAQRPYSYRTEGVNLWFQVERGEGMNWGLWDEVLGQFAIYGFLNKWRGVQFFVVRLAAGGGSLVARGQLVEER